MLVEKKDRNWIAVISADSKLYWSICKMEKREWVTIILPTISDLLSLMEEGVSLHYVVWHVPVFRETQMKFCIQWRKKHPGTRMLVVIDKEIQFIIGEGYHFQELVEFYILQGNYDTFVQYLQRNLSDFLRSITSEELLQSDIELFPGIVVKPSIRCLDNNGIVESLPGKEYELLMYFVKNRGQFVTIEQILFSVWDEFASPDNARQIIYKLRKKLHRNKYPHNILLYFRGIGYTLLDRDNYHLLSMNKNN
jgi:DNA-binding winged helix-turn-helix (wHTH) protein